MAPRAGALHDREMIHMDEPGADEPSEVALPRRALDTLFAKRTLLLFGEITTALASRVAAELLALAALGDAPIRMLVHSPGGHVESGDTTTT